MTTVDGGARSLPRRLNPVVIPKVTVIGSQYAGGGSLYITLPTGGFDPGDLLLLFCGTYYNTTSTPSGWTKLCQTGGGWQGATLFSKFADTGDYGDNISISMSGSEPWRIWFVAIPNGVTYSQGCGQSTSGTSRSTDAPLTLQTSSQWLYTFGSFRQSSGTLSTTPTGTEVFSYTGGTSPRSYCSVTPIGGAGGSIQPSIHTSVATQGLAILAVTVGQRG